MSSVLQLYKRPLHTIVSPHLREEQDEEDQKKLDVAKAAIEKADKSLRSIMDPLRTWSSSMHAHHFSAMYALRQVSDKTCADLWKFIECAERLAIFHAFVTANGGGLKKLRGMFLMSRGEQSILRYDGLHSEHIVPGCVCRNCTLKRQAQIAVLCPQLMLCLGSLPLEAKDVIAVILATDV
jgi:hypothetical protein